MKNIIILIAFGFFILNFVLPALATHTSSATISPEWAKGGMSYTFTVSVTNTGGDKITYVKIQVPTSPSAFTLTDCEPAPSGWIADESELNLGICRYSSSIGISPSQSVDFSVTATTATTEGTYAWMIKTRDENDAWAPAIYPETKIDNTPPTTTITPNGQTWTNQDVSFALTCVDKQADGVTDGSGCKQTYYQIIDATAACPSVGDATYSAGSSGTVTCADDSICVKKVCFYSVDNVDNTPSNPSESGGFQIDKKAPPAPVINDEPTYTKGTSNTVSWNAVSDEGSGNVQYLVQRATNDGFTENVVESGWIDGISYEFTGLTDGQTYYYRVKARDAAGNEGSWSNVVSSTQDDTPPSIANPTPAPNDFTNTNTPTISIEIMDTTSGVDDSSIVMKVNNGEVSPTVISIANGYRVQYTPTSPFSNGLVTVTIDASDNVGNAMSTYTWSFTVDTIPPSVTVTSPNGGEIWAGGSTQTIEWTATDDNMVDNPITIYYSYDGGEWIQIATNEMNDGTYEWSLPTIDSTNVLIKITAIDKAGNVGEDVSDSTFTIDSTNPTTNIISPAEGSWQNSDFDVTLTDNDNVGLSQCKYRVLSLDGSEWQVTKDWTTRACSTTVTLTVGPDKDCRNEGANSCKIEAYVIDKANNEGNIVSRTFSIDTVKPTTTDDYSSKDGVWQNSDQTIKLTLNDPAPSSGIEWTRFCIDTTNECDPASGTDYTEPVTITTEGIVYFRYASKDNAGNVQDTVSRTVKIDKTSPTVTITSPTQNQVVVNTLNLVVTTTDANSVSCTYNINGGQEISIDCSGGTIDVSAYDGRTTITVTATDVAGNTGSDSVTFIANNDTILTVAPCGADFTSIQEAIDGASPGDTISVAAGVYNEHIVIDKPLTLLGAQANVDPTVEGARTDPSLESIIVGTGGGYDDAAIVIELSQATEEKEVIINGFTIKNPGGDYGIVLPSSPASPPYKDAIVEYNIITECRYGIESWYGEAAGSVIRKNLITGNTYGIDCYRWYTTIALVIEGNKFVNNDAGIYMGYTQDFLIRNNTFADNDYGIYIYYDDGSEAHYNNFVENTEYGIFNEGEPAINATLNYWGCKEGPENSTCDAVSDYVNYQPWLSYFYPETNGPLLSDLEPTGVIADNTPELRVTTDEYAYCRYSTSNVSYSEMTNQFSSDPAYPSQNVT